MFYIPFDFFRDAYWIIKESPGIKLEAHFEELEKNKCRRILGYFIEIVIIILTFFFCFGFCVCYKYQQSTWLILTLIGCGLDLLVFEILMEVFILIVLKLNEEYQFDTILASELITFRNFRVLCE